MIRSRISSKFEYECPRPTRSLVATCATLDFVSGSISVRELRNKVSEVLRRVESGERVTVTVDRRPVAEIVPMRRRTQDGGTTRALLDTSFFVATEWDDPRAT